MDGFDKYPLPRCHATRTTRGEMAFTESTIESLTS